jgi:hypothetical protein
MVNYNIVLVHKGNQFYDYINDCIFQICRFNTCPVYIISNDIHKDKVIKHNQVIFIPIESLTKTKTHEFFEKTKTYDTSFRDSFHKSVTERFFLIEEVMIKLSLENVFHIENDNLIYTDLNNILDVFTSNYTFSSVFDNDQRCVPSFIYIKDVNSINNLNNFIIDSPQSNDMDLLSNFRYTQPQFINLPILPNFYDKKLISQIGHTTNNPGQYFNNFELFNSIFDAACIGQYLGGVDPRNNPNDSIGFINESSLFNPSVFNYSFKEDSKGRKIPILSFNNKEIKINNLHIHSKNLKNFI